MEHEELIKEFPFVQQLSLMERKRLAKKRRKTQVKNYQQWNLSEEESNNSEKSANTIKDTKNRNKSVKFTSGVELLEAVTQADIKHVKKLLDAGKRTALGILIRIKTHH